MTKIGRKDPTGEDAAKDPLINPDPYCPVRLKPVGRRGEKFLAEIQMADSETWVDIPGVHGSTHGKNYQLVKNADVHAMAQRVMAKTGLAFKPIPSFGSGHSKSLIWNGRYYVERWYTPEVTIKSPNGKSDVMLGLQVHNSYDTSYPVGLAFFAMHCACSNQFHSRALFRDPFEFTHTASDLEGDFSKALAELEGKAAGFAQIAPTLQKLQQTQVVTFRDFLALRKGVCNIPGITMDFREKALLDELSGQGITAELGIKVGDAYGDPSSYWAIANAFTALTTHKLAADRGQKQASALLDLLIFSADHGGYQPGMENEFQKQLAA